MPGVGGHLGLEGTVNLQASNIIYGEAIHPIKTYHPNEWPNVRVYLEDELKRAAETLRGAPLLLDHTHLLNGRVLDVWYEDGAVKYLAELNDEGILNMIRNGVIKHCSVEYDWRSLEKVNGLAPKGIKFTGLALLKDFPPGDPQATVQVWEGIIRHLKNRVSGRIIDGATDGHSDRRGRAILTPLEESTLNLNDMTDLLESLRGICYEGVPGEWRCLSCPQNRKLKGLIRRLEDRLVSSGLVMIK